MLYRWLVGESRLMSNSEPPIVVKNELFTIVWLIIAWASWERLEPCKSEVVWFEVMLNTPTNGAENFDDPSAQGKSRNKPNPFCETSGEYISIPMVSLSCAHIVVTLTLIPCNRKLLEILPVHRSSVWDLLIRSVSAIFKTFPEVSENRSPMRPRFTRFGLEISHCWISDTPPYIYVTFRPWLSSETPLYERMSSRVLPAGNESFFHPQEDIIAKGRNVCKPVMSAPNAKLPLPICIGVTALEAFLVGLYRVTKECRFISLWAASMGVARIVEQIQRHSHKSM